MNLTDSPHKSIQSTPLTLHQAVSRSLPLEVELLRLHQYQINLKHGLLAFAVLKLYIPEHKQTALQRWQEDAESTFGMKFFIQRERIYSGLRKQLEHLAPRSGLLGAEQGADITRILDHFNGSAPNLLHLTTKPTIPRTVRDRLFLPFITIDAEEVRGREDAVYAEHCRGGNIRLYIAIVDVTWLFKPGSYIDLYAQKLGASIYGSKRIISTIGMDLALGPASLEPQAERCAWIIEVFIRPGGQSLLSTPPYRARIAVAQHYCPRELNAMLTSGAPLPPAASALIEACRRLHAARMQTQKIVRLKGDGSAETIVAESMIAAKHWSAHYLSGRAFAPPIYKVHAAPQTEEKMQMINELASLGISAKPADFDNPLKFARLLGDLQRQTLQLRDNHSADGKALMLADQIIEHFLMRSRYDSRNLGHHALGLSAYLDIKPRDASGIANQFQLYAASEEPQRALTQEEIAIRVRARNRKLSRHDRMTFRLRFLEMLERKLTWVGTLHQARVVEVKADHALIEVPDFSKWGVLTKNGTPLAPGQILSVQLNGFCSKSMRFSFSETQALTPGS